MQLQDKLVDGAELAHAESQQREDLLVHGEDRLPEPQVEALPDAAMVLRGQLLGAIRMLLDGQTLEVSQLHVPQREERALEALQAAVEGKSARFDHFVYASDRRDLLEQALAVLQPNLTRADDQTAHELHAQFADLAERVGELRHRLTDLEDAQDELLEAGQKEALAKGDAEPSDKPKPKPRPSDPDAPRPATTLTGPDRPEPPPAPTTLVGPDRPVPPRPATTLTGPDRPEPPPAPTTLIGPDRPVPPRPPTTLTGPELPPEPEPASSLGEGGPGGETEDAAAKAKRPWWKRPFG